MGRPSKNSDKEPTTVDEQTGKNLFRLRQSSGLRGEDVAQSLGMSTGGYLQYERGTRSVSLVVLARLARYFNVKPSKLITGIENFVE